MKVFPPSRKNLARSSESGMTMLEGLFGILMVGIAAGAVLTGMRGYFSQKQYAKKIPVISRYASQVVYGGINVLSATDNAGKKTQGVCGLVSTDVTEPGVSMIDINVFPPNAAYKRASGVGAPFTDAHWQNSLRGWVLAKSPVKECKKVDHWNKCFTVDPANKIEMDDAKLAALDLVAALRIEPIFTNPVMGLFKPVQFNDATSPFSTDVKDIGFNVTAEIFYNRFSPGGKDEPAGRVSKVLREFLWAPSVGICNYKLKNGRDVILSLSGNGASDPTGSTVFNRYVFTRGKRDPINVTYRKTQIQEGIISSNGSFIKTDTSKNIATSCNEKRYRCPNTPSNQREYGKVDIFMDLEYFPQNALVDFSSSMRAVPLIDIRQGRDSAISAQTAIAYQFDGSPASSVVTSGSHTLYAQVTDAGKSDSANSMCREVCRDSNNYNRKGLLDADRYMAELSLKYPDFNKLYTYSAGEGVGCTACYMKNCSQIGLGTFGPMDKQPYQPLDSSIPECWVTDWRDNEEPYKQGHFIVESGGSGDCLSARYQGSSDQLTLRRRECSDRLPVLCYNFGRFMLARALSSMSWTLSESDFDRANDACFQMSKETVNAADLDQLVGRAMSELPREGNNYAFNNLAIQGIFLAPQVKQDVIELRKWILKEGINNTEFWVSLKHSDKGPVAVAPKLPPASSNAKFALLYDNDGRISFREYDFNLSKFKSSADEYAPYLLFHHIRYKGVIVADKEQERSLRFLCRKSNDVFVSSGRSTKSADGEGICKKEGGTFRPIETPMEWVKAMMEAAPLEVNQSYPDLKVANAEGIDPLWVMNKLPPPPPPPPPPPEETPPAESPAPAEPPPETPPAEGGP